MEHLISNHVEVILTRLLFTYTTHIVGTQVFGSHFPHRNQLTLSSVLAHNFIDVGSRSSCVCHAYLSPVFLTVPSVLHNESHSTAHVGDFSYVLVLLLTH